MRTRCRWKTRASARGGGPLGNVLLMLNASQAFERARESDSFNYSVVEYRNAVLYFLTFDRSGGVSIRETIARARQRPRGARIGQRRSLEPVE